MTKEEHLAAIKQADHEYYDLDNPSLTDAAYDKLRRDYIDQYGSEDLDYVPGTASEGFEKFRHPTPVTSLLKWTKGKDEMSNLMSKIEELWPVVIQPKFDGMTVVAYPNPDGSCKFVTRGGGDVGEVLPNFIPAYEGPGINDTNYPIRGEAYITPWNFKRLNARLIEAGEEPMKNMRNTASGLLRRKERSPHLDLLSYRVYDIPGADMTPDEMRIAITEGTVFTFAQYWQCDTVQNTIDEIERRYKEILDEESEPIDGMVIKSCQENSLKKFGATEHHPKNAFAWKTSETQEEFETVLRDVIWQIGKSKATPVGITDPVEIDGASVTHVTLNNVAWLKERGIKLNSRIAVRRSGQVIPNFVRVIEPGDKDIILDVCPACGGPMEEINGQQFCRNPKCEERIAQTINFLVGKEVLDIPDFSIETARKIVDACSGTKAYINSYPDIEKYKQNVIFILSAGQIEKLPGYAKKSANKLYDAIQAARHNVEFPTFIKALCLPGIGNNVGKILAEEFQTLEKIADAWSKHYDWTKLKGIGPKTASTLDSNEFMDAMIELSKYVNTLPYEKKEVDSAMSNYAGKTFVLTGKAPKPRSFYEGLITNAGAKVGSAVNSKTDYLVIADVNSTSSKARKARELGTQLISPEELEEMLG